MKRILVALLCLGAFGTTQAQTSSDEQRPPMQSAEMPKNGQTMERVLESFGEPSQRIAAVGEPPITRWQYPGFTVYFEYDRVIHAVVHPA